MTDRRRGKRATMLDVAQIAGVSYQTVSRVINEQPNVKAETRQRVLDVIAELHYRPDRNARSLAAHQTKTLAMITFGIDYYGPLQMAINVEAAARDAGYDLITATLEDTDYGPVRSVLDRLLAWRVDGVVLIASIYREGSEQLIRYMNQTPMIVLDNRLGSPVPSVAVDQRTGGYTAAKHLLDLGHRKIGIINGPKDWFGAFHRREGWLNALHEAGLEPVFEQEGDWSAADGYIAVNEEHEKGADYTALLCGNDTMALGAITALRGLGKRIPEDISLVGFDGMPDSQYYDPALTTVYQPFRELGLMGLNYLLDLINDPYSARGQQVIEPVLFERKSTARIG